MTKKNQKVIFSETTLVELSNLVETWKVSEKSSHDTFAKQLTDKKSIHFKMINLYSILMDEAKAKDISSSNKHLWDNTAFHGPALKDYRAFLAIMYKESKAFREMIVKEESTGWNGALSTWKRLNKKDAKPKTWQQELDALLSRHEVPLADVLTYLSAKAQEQLPTEKPADVVPLKATGTQ